MLLSVSTCGSKQGGQGPQEVTTKRWLQNKIKMNYFFEALGFETETEFWDTDTAFWKKKVERGVNLNEGLNMI